jgi:hypothetical protein
LERIAVDDFTIELLGNPQGECAFPGACRSDDREKREIPGLVWGHLYGAQRQSRLTK